jgi:hypothetical protein
MTLGQGWAAMDGLRYSTGLDARSRTAAEAWAQAWSGWWRHLAVLDGERAEGLRRGV